jgi:hypothetical protein
MTETQTALVQRHGKMTGYQMFDPDSDGGSEGRTYNGEATTWLSRSCPTVEQIEALVTEMGVKLPFATVAQTWVDAFREGWEEALYDQCQFEAGAQWDS